ncbi:putative structural maintenance of chromosomes protein 6-like [Sesbania bispinosa]|nr:putative structural maintenance of chromosomes protein 6-like [Sesbania bispinosa]
MKKAVPNPVSIPTQVAAKAPTKDGNDQVNHNPNHAPDFAAQEDLYGDWITVTKKKKEHKSRGKDIKSNGTISVEDKTNQGIAVVKPHVSGNKFSTLINSQCSDTIQIFSSEKHDPGSSGHIASGEDKYKPFMKAAGLGEESKAQKETQLVIPKATANELIKNVPSSSKTQAHVKELQGGIRILMEVEYVGPNQLRFVDNPEPPDPTCDEPNRKMDDTGSQGSGQPTMGRSSTINMEEGHSEDSEEDQEMVADSYAGPGAS